MRTYSKARLISRCLRQVVLTLAIALVCWSGHADSIVNSVHNLTASGPGTNKATVTMDVCVFCHTSHRSNGATPLWNHDSSSVSNYIVYSSAKLDAMGLTIPQPNGASRLCLSCHDGTVALGSISSRTTPIQMQNNVTTLAGHANLGTDLSGDHPISFVYDADLVTKDPTLKYPSTLTGKVRLDGNGRLQCTACHNPHDNQFGNFLVMDNTGSAICLSCHSEGTWSGSSHSISGAAAPVIAGTKTSAKLVATKAKTTTVAAMGCQSCHANHKAGSKARLMHFDAPDDNCLSCHAGLVSQKSLASDVRKPSSHTSTLNGKTHDPNENIVNPSARHVVCADCHNGHAANGAKATAPNAPGSLAGVAGVTASGAVTRTIQMEYELCFRCHADSVQRGGPLLTRQFPETNKRLTFSAGNRSFHPVVAPAKRTDSPSLIAPWKSASMIYCTDCHNSDQGPRAGGSGPDGPHGSKFTPLLERQLVTTDFNPESPASYALCYKCHSRSVIISDQENSWKYHRKHVVDKQTACTTCHDSHGVATNPGLINFNTLYVSANNGMLSFNDGAPGTRSCTLTCHGKAHDTTLRY